MVWCLSGFMGCGKTSVGRALQRLAAAARQDAAVGAWPASAAMQPSGGPGTLPAEAPAPEGVSLPLDPTAASQPACGVGAWPAGSSPFRLTPPSAGADGPPAIEPRVLRPGQPGTHPAGSPIRFVDLDEEIVRREGRSVQEIFRTRGEAAFRTAEYDALADLIGSYSGDETLLIALGGGTLMQPDSRELVRACCHCIYLRASVQTLASHLSGARADSIPGTNATDAGTVASPASLSPAGAHCATSAAAPEVAARPLLAGPGTLEEKIARILEDRAAVYESTARHIIDTDGRSVSDLAASILSLL